MASAVNWPGGARCAIMMTFDLDGESPWIQRDAALADRPLHMSMGAYGPKTGMPRILDVLDRYAIKTCVFIPGWIVERYPDMCREVLKRGHEIGHHGYLHEGARSAPDFETEERRLIRGLEALDAVAGVRPVGYRAPMWELSYRLPALLAKHGFLYDSGLMDADHPYRLATSPEPGAPSIVELPGHWSLDDWEPYNYLPGITGSGVIASPADVLARWTLELEALVAEGGLFMLTNHPFISGRPSRAVALETLIERAKAIDGLWIASAGEIAAHVATLPLEPVVHRPHEA
jgi:peptidoglycan-N-acetylglucosamine deacetylase